MPGFDADIDRGALALLLRHNYIPAPYSIYRGIHKLPPGTWIEVEAAHASGEPLPAPLAYWSARQITAQAQAARPVFDSDERAADALESVLTEAVQAQMLSDVSLGAFLSGGVDSSVVAALMQARGSAPVRTFSMGFHDRRYDETAHAAAVARHLGTRHTQLTITPLDALAVVPLLADIYDEPYADASQIPMVLLSRLARRDVTVALSGDGGDELFGGYARYARAQRWWQRRDGLPVSLRQPVAGVLAAAARLPGGGAWRGKAAKAGDLLRARDQAGFYRRLVSYWDDPALAIQDGSEPPTLFDDPMQGRFADAMMLRDTLTYLPDDILVKVDRAAMACGLETRVPMLDHRVYAFAQGLAPHHKIRRGQGKWLLRQVLYRHVPRALVDRPKQGFGVPLAAWLRGPLREWANDLLDSATLRRQGLFQPEPIAHKWREHISGRCDWSGHLWSVLMAQSWLDGRRLRLDSATPDVGDAGRHRERP
jgi:asparagine synthase (glutamine-hydrolysing)